MAEKNLITITGYLKENTLEQVISSTGKNAIRGNLIISTGPLESHKVQFYVSETTSTGAESKEYQNLLNMLPEKTTTLASYLAANPEADFEDACACVSKVWAAGSLDEYARKSEEKGELSTIQLRGRRAGFKTASATGKEFETKARFEVEVYLSEITPELTETGEATGRLNVVGLIQNYDQSVSKIDFIAPVENGVADYISKNYAVADTVHINGEFINLMHRKLIQSASENHFGTGGRDQYETTFTNERRILGGDTKPVHQGEEGSISTSAVKIGLAKRESKMIANGQKTPAPKANFNKTTTTNVVTSSDEDVDF